MLSERKLKIQKIIYQDKAFAHNIHTPYDLCKEMIDNINISEQETFLVLYNLEFVITLIEDYKINPSNVTLYSPGKIEKTLCNKLGVNYIYDLENDMKFDVVIGNPPYDSSSGAKNNKLWKTFSISMLDKADVIAFVTPEGALSDSSNGLSLQRKIKESGYGFTACKLHDREGFNHFKNVGVATCHWIINKNSKDLVSPLLFTTKKPIDALAQSICDKVTSYSQKLPLRMDNGHLTRSDLNDNGKNKILFSGQKESFTDNNVTTNGLKLVFPFSASYHSAFTTKEATGQLNLVMDVEDQEEADFILSYTMSPLFKLVANTYRKTSGFTPFVKNVMIPDLRKKDISDLYNTFNLTQEEIDYVERNSK